MATTSNNLNDDTMTMMMEKDTAATAGTTTTTFTTNTITNKRQCRRPHNHHHRHRRVDPTKILNEQCMFTIFSFLAENPSSSHSFTLDFDRERGKRRRRRQQQQQRFQRQRQQQRGQGGQRQGLLLENDTNDEEEDGNENENETTNTTTTTFTIPNIKTTSTGMCLMAAYDFHTSFACVSPKWENLIDQFLFDLVSGICIDFNTIPTLWIPTLCHWASQHQFRIASLLMGFHQNYDPAQSDLYLTKTLEKCDLSQLNRVQTAVELTLEEPSGFRYNYETQRGEFTNTTTILKQTIDLVSSSSKKKKKKADNDHDGSSGGTGGTTTTSTTTNQKHQQHDNIMEFTLDLHDHNKPHLETIRQTIRQMFCPYLKLDLISNAFWKEIVSQHQHFDWKLSLPFDNSNNNNPDVTNLNSLTLTAAAAVPVAVANNKTSSSSSSSSRFKNQKQGGGAAAAAAVECCSKGSIEIISRSLSNLDVSDFYRGGAGGLGGGVPIRLNLQCNSLTTIKCSGSIHDDSVGGGGVVDGGDGSCPIRLYQVVEENSIVGMGCQLMIVGAAAAAGTSTSTTALATLPMDKIPLGQEIVEYVRPTTAPVWKQY